MFPTRKPVSPTAICASLAADGPINQDQIKRLTRAGMGACQGRRCREQVQLLLAMQGNQPTGSVPLPSYRAPLRPLPLNVLSAHDETAEMRDNWVVLVRHPQPVAAAMGAGSRRHRSARRPSRCCGISKMSVIVIGGGATGLSTAWWLRREGVPVTVVEKGIVGWEASGRNGGGATHASSPLFREEQRLWPMMDELLGYPTEHQKQRIRIAVTPTQLANWNGAIELAEQQGFAVERLDPKALRELVPWVGDDVAGGMLLHFGGHANPQRTVQAYAWAIQDLGGTILQHTTVTGIQVRGGKAVAVETDQGVIGCDAVVIAAGPHTGADCRDDWRGCAGGAGAGGDDRHRTGAADPPWRG